MRLQRRSAYTCVAMPSVATPFIEPRPMCARCERPKRVCWCAHLPALEPATKVLVLQHPREEDVAIGTARMASLCLAGSSLVVGVHVEDDPRVRAALDDTTRRPILLWPGGDAIDILERPPSGPTTLVVVDGTWSLAKKLVKSNPRIAALPRYALGVGAPSEYRIRREPAEGCLSTIEAIARALGAMEGDPARWAAMLTPFREMVDAQIDHQQRLNGGRVRSWAGGGPRPRKPRPVPVKLRDPSRVVLITAEGNAWPWDASARPADELVHLVAVRLDGSATLEALCTPSGELSPTTPSHAGLDGDAILAAPPAAAAIAAWRAFVREDDVLCSWGTYAPDLLARAGASLPPGQVDLRVAAAAFLGRRAGSVESCCARLELATTPCGAGRAGARLGATLALARHLAAAAR